MRWAHRRGDTTWSQQLELAQHAVGAEKGGAGTLIFPEESGKAITDQFMLELESGG